MIVVRGTARIDGPGGHGFNLGRAALIARIAGIVFGHHVVWIRFVHGFALFLWYLFGLKVDVFHFDAFGKRVF